MRTLRLLAALSALLSAVAAHAELVRIGAAAAVAGRVQAVSPGQPVGRVVSSGKPLFLNDHVTTDKEGRLQVLLLDQTVFTLGPNSDLVLDEFVYDPATGAGKVTASIAKGVFRFVTGKIAQKKPDEMKVKLPTATIGIRGTIVFGVVDGRTAVIGLGGPGFSNNTGDRYGAINVSNSGGSSDVTRPGYGTTVNGSNAPTPPAPVPAAILNQVVASLNPPPPPAAPAQGAGAGGQGPASAAGSESGQAAANATGSASSSNGQAALSQALNNVSVSATQDNTALAVGDVLTDFAEFSQLATVPGSGSYNTSGAFSQTLCSGSACSITGTWTYNFTVDFAARNINGSASIDTLSNSGTISDSASFNQGLPASGSGVFQTTSGSGGTYNFLFFNSNGQIAQKVLGTATFDNGTDKGTGAALTAPMVPVNNNN